MVARIYMIEWSRTQRTKKLLPKDDLVREVCRILDIKADLTPLNQKDLKVVLNKPVQKVKTAKTKKEAITVLKDAYPEVKTFERVSKDALLELIKGLNK